MEKYVKCIKALNQGQDQYSAGKIYKVNSLEYIIGNNGIATSMVGSVNYDNHFQKALATEEEWNKQEGIKKGLQPGNFYTHKNGNIIKYINNSGSYPHISIAKNSYNSYGGCFDITEYNYVVSTSEEKQWLEACIKANRFVPKEEALKPEQKSISSFEVGKTYTQCNNDTSTPWRIFRPINENYCHYINLTVDVYLAGEGIYQFRGSTDIRISTEAESIQMDNCIKAKAFIGKDQKAGKTAPKPSKVELIPGKWYKATKDGNSLYWIFKHRGLGGKDVVICDNYRSSNQVRMNGVCGALLEVSYFDFVELKPEDEEIQKYLPEGHVDKITKTETNIEEILAECKRRFPIGSKFKCANNNVDKFIFGTGSEKEKDAKKAIYTVESYDTHTTVSPFGVYTKPNGWMYLNGKWATPVESTPKELELIEGKWYKFKAYGFIYFAKYTKGLSYINSNKWFINGFPYTSGAAWDKGNVSNLELADMEEVYKYCPEERPKTNVPFEECKEKTMENAPKEGEYWIYSRTGDSKVQYDDSIYLIESIRKKHKKCFDSRIKQVYYNNVVTKDESCPYSFYFPLSSSWRKATISEMSLLDIPKKSKVDELLEEAFRRYPIGTKFKIAHQPDKIVTVKNHERYTYLTESTINLYVEEAKEDCLGACVYSSGRWAEIVKEEKMDLLEYAKKNYPIGTWFKSSTDGGKIRQVKPYKGDDTIEWRLLSDNSVYCQSGMYNEETCLCSNPTIYKNGKWDEVVFEPKGQVPEYVEVIKGGPNNTNHPEHKNSYVLNYEKDKKVFKVIRLCKKTSPSYICEGGYVLYEDSCKPSTKEAYDAQFKKNSSYESVDTGVYRFYNPPMYKSGIDPWERRSAVVGLIEKKGFDEKEHLSRPINQRLTVKIKKLNKTKSKLILK